MLVSLPFNPVLDLCGSVEEVLHLITACHKLAPNM